MEHRKDQRQCSNKAKDQQPKKESDEDQNPAWLLFVRRSSPSPDPTYAQKEEQEGQPIRRHHLPAILFHYKVHHGQKHC